MQQEPDIYCFSPLEYFLFLLVKTDFFAFTRYSKNFLSYSSFRKDQTVEWPKEKGPEKRQSFGDHPAEQDITRNGKGGSIVPSSGLFVNRSESKRYPSTIPYSRFLFNSPKCPPNPSKGDGSTFKFDIAAAYLHP